MIILRDAELWATRRCTDGERLPEGHSSRCGGEDRVAALVLARSTLRRDSCESFCFGSTLNYLVIILRIKMLQFRNIIE